MGRRYPPDDVADTREEVDAFYEQIDAYDDNDYDPADGAI